MENFTKQNGVFFTPAGLSSLLSGFLVDNLETFNDLQILDPSCGDGILLKSMYDSLKGKGRNNIYYGIDIEKQFISNSNTNLEYFECQRVLKEGDFLNLETPISNDFKSKFDVIIANPPYVRTQVLGADYAKKLSDKYKLKGRIDLYFPFLIEMTESLKEGGLIGVITSNRYLSTKGGESIRKYLTTNYEIIDVIDLGDTKLFDAAVLPAILIGRKRINKKGEIKSSHFRKIYEKKTLENNLPNFKDIYSIIRNNKIGKYTVSQKAYDYSCGELFYVSGSKDIWSMLTEEDSKWIDTINLNAKNTISDIFKVRVGVKTTADKVFIKKDWDSLKGDIPEQNLLFPLISQNNIEKWKLNKKEKQKILYTHYVENNKKKVINIDNYPKAKKYLCDNKERLSSRSYIKKSKRNWYEIWVPQNPDFWKYPKLVFPDISSKSRFVFDDKGYIVNGNCYWMFAQNEIETNVLFLVQGVCNSKLMEKYHDLMFSNKLYSGKRRYFSQFVENYPLPDVHNQFSKKIIQKVKLVNNTEREQEILRLEKQIESLVEKAFGVFN